MYDEYCLLLKCDGKNENFHNSRTVYREYYRTEWIEITLLLTGVLFRITIFPQGY